MAVVLKIPDPYYSMDPFKALEEIEGHINEICDMYGGGHEYWKLRVDALRASMMTPELKKEMYNTACSLYGTGIKWHSPFNQLQETHHR